MAELTRITIHVAKTRPAMKFGLPIEMLIVLGIITVEIGVLVGFFYMLFMLPIWWGAARLVRKDFNFPRVFVLWLRSSALDFEASYWGGVSVEPYPSKIKEYRGMRRV